MTSFDTVKRIICDDLKLTDPALVTPAATLEDLVLDSLDLTEVMLALEDEFKFEPLDEAIEGCATVGQIADVVDGLLAARVPS